MILSGTDLDFAIDVRFGGRPADFDCLGSGALRVMAPVGSAVGHVDVWKWSRLGRLPQYIVRINRLSSSVCGLWVARGAGLAA